MASAYTVLPSAIRLHSTEQAQQSYIVIVESVASTDKVASVELAHVCAKYVQHVQ